MKTEWAHDFHQFCPAPLDDDLVARLNWLTAAVFRVTGCLDVARVDFRLDADQGTSRTSSKSILFPVYVPG
jgi:D-alanine-D-alanine ligase-like ATP-grasp enzyme